MKMPAVEPVAESPAEVYEAHFVPALFAPWAEVLAEVAALGPGQRVVDVACGTGVAARYALERVGTSGHVSGVDPNPEMLAVARRTAPEVAWWEGPGEALPFADDSFDAVINQFGLMFFSDPVAGLREMRRVLRSTGTLALAVCDALDHSPGYAVFAELLQRLFGPGPTEAFRAPFVLGDRALLEALCREAGLEGATVERRDGAVRFDSIASLVSTERACAWTLGGVLDNGQFDQLMAAAEESLQPFTDGAGHVTFNMPALIVKAGAAP